MKDKRLTKRTLLATVAAIALVFGAATWVANVADAHGTGPGAGGPGYGMGQMMGSGQGYGAMMGHMMGGYGGWGHMGGSGGWGHMGGSGTAVELTPEKVKTLIEARLIMHGGDNLKVGKVEAKDADTIIAEIVTKDGSLVETVTFPVKGGAPCPFGTTK